MPSKRFIAFSRTLIPLQRILMFLGPNVFTVHDSEPCVTVRKIFTSWSFSQGRETFEFSLNVYFTPINYLWKKKFLMLLHWRNTLFITLLSIRLPVLPSCVQIMYWRNLHTAVISESLQLRKIKYIQADYGCFLDMYVIALQNKNTSQNL